MTTTPLPLEIFQQNCPGDCDLLLTSVPAIEDLRPGDLVMQYRPNNGRRGALRVTAAVTVARYVPKGPDDE